MARIVASETPVSLATTGHFLNIRYRLASTAR